MTEFKTVAEWTGAGYSERSEHMNTSEPLKNAKLSYHGEFGEVSPQVGESHPTQEELMRYFDGAIEDTATQLRVQAHLTTNCQECNALLLLLSVPKSSDEELL